MERQVKGPQLRSGQLDLRRVACPAHPGLRDGAGKGQAHGRVWQGRDDLPRLDHAAGQGVERRVSPLPARSSPAASTPTPCSGPKRFFGSARRVEEGGSAHDHRHRSGRHRKQDGRSHLRGVQRHGQPRDLPSTAALVDKRIWPAIDINRSRHPPREEMLMDPEEHRRVCVLRRVLNDMNPPEAMEFLTTRLMKTKTNAEFLMSMNMKG